MKNNKDLTDLILELYKEVTPQGQILLDKLIDKIVFQLENIRQILDLQNENPTTGRK